MSHNNSDLTTQPPASGEALDIDPFGKDSNDRTPLYYAVIAAAEQKVAGNLNQEVEYRKTINALVQKAYDQYGEKSSTKLGEEWFCLQVNAPAHYPVGRIFTQEAVGHFKESEGYGMPGMLTGYILKVCTFVSSSEGEEAVREKKRGLLKKLSEIDTAESSDCYFHEVLYRVVNRILVAQLAEQREELASKMLDLLGVVEFGFRQVLGFYAFAYSQKDNRQDENREAIADFLKLDGDPAVARALTELAYRKLKAAGSSETLTSIKKQLVNQPVFKAFATVTDEDLKALDFLEQSAAA